MNCDNWMNIQLREVICTSRVSSTLEEGRGERERGREGKGERGKGGERERGREGKRERGKGGRGGQGRGRGGVTLDEYPAEGGHLHIDSKLGKGEERRVGKGNIGVLCQLVELFSWLLIVF